MNAFCVQGIQYQARLESHCQLIISGILYDSFSMLADTFYGSEQNFTLPLPEDPKLTEIKLCAVLRSGVGRSVPVFKHNITLQAGSSFSQTNDSRATRYKVQKLYRPINVQVFYRGVLNTHDSQIYLGWMVGIWANWIWILQFFLIFYG